MRTIKQLSVPQVSDPARFPNGTIQNETDTVQGTPVVREIYGDVLTNIYAILADAGIAPSGNEDDEQRGYQLLQALKQFANGLNDIEQVLSLVNNEWSINMPVDHLPNNYILFAKAAENYNDAVTYTFTGNDSNSYGLTSPTGFNAGDEVLIILDRSGVRAIGLSNSTKTDLVTTVFGTPVVFNDSANMYYQEGGALLTDTPSTDDLQVRIRVLDGDGALLVYTMMVIQGHVLCLCFLPSTVTYKFYHFSIGDLNTPVLVSVNGLTIPTGTNNEPYIFTDGNTVYLTNDGGTTADDFSLAGFVYDPVNASLTFTSTKTVANTYLKTTNGVIQGNELVTFINGQLTKYNLDTGTETQLDQYTTFNGILFSFKGGTYYTNGETAKQWTI